MRETDLFYPVKAWLEERGYDVYTEVESKYTGGRADIVAVAGPAVTVVEMKLTLSLDLIAQAVRWKPFVNYVFIAVPQSRHRKIHGYADIFLRREGIGLLEVRDYGHFTDVRARLEARFNRRVNDHIRKSLVPQHKELPGGHAGGGYVTPYRITIDRVKQYLRSVKKNDGWVTIKDILDHCETHYAAPKPSLSKALTSFENDWCETKKEGGKLWFRMKN